MSECCGCGRDDDSGGQLMIEMFTSPIIDCCGCWQGWIITSGTDVGVSRLIGEARAKFAPEVPLLGIASWSSIHQKDILQYTHERFEQDRCWSPRLSFVI
jgi:hypothetical protein